MAARKNIALEVMSESKELIQEVSERLPECNYYFFSATTLIVPAILTELIHMRAAFPGMNVIDPLWNYLDSGCSIVSGLLQTADRYHHRQWVNKIKGMLNIASGVEITVLSALSFSLLGGFSFAGAFGVGFIISVEEIFTAARRRHDIEYWFKDSLAELERINAVILPSLEKEIIELQDLQSKSPAKTNQWLIKRKENHFKKYNTRKKEIEEQINFRVMHRIHKNDSMAKNELRAFDTMLEAMYIDFSKETQNFLKELGALSKMENDALPIKYSPVQCVEEERKICAKNNAEVKKAIRNGILWGVSFVGMLLLCFPLPGLQVAGFALISIASLWYLSKHIDKLTAGVSKMLPCFFASKKEDNKPRELLSENVLPSSSS